MTWEEEENGSEKKCDLTFSDDAEVMLKMNVILIGAYFLFDMIT